MYSRELIFFGAALNNLDISPYLLTTSAGNIHAHKQLFLLQETGFPIKYKFSSNLWGPFSEDVGDLIGDWKLNNVAQSLVGSLKVKAELKPFFDMVKKLKRGPYSLLSDGSDWVSMVASIHWGVRDRALYDLSACDNQVIEIKDSALKKYPYFPSLDSDFPIIWNRLQLVYANPQTPNS